MATARGSLGQVVTLISVEDVFEKLGGFSWFQMWAMVVIISPEIVAAMIALSPVLTGSSDVLFVCETLTGRSFNISAEDIKTDDVCDGILRPMGHHYTSVWSLVGSKAWVSDLVTSVQMLGSMTGALLASQFAESFGRKKAHFGLCFLMGGFGFASGWAPDPYSYAATRFVAGFAVGGCFVVYMNYLMEFLTPSFRTICGCVSLWAVGEMMLAFIAYNLPHWRHLTFATTLPTFLIFFAYPFFPESPRWLLCKERTEEALEVFDKIARWNRKPGMDPAEIKTLQKCITHSVDSSSESLSIVESFKILKFKEFRVQLVILMVAWFTCQLVYYGISFNMKHLDGNPYWNVFYMGVLDLPGSFTGILFNNRLGRKKTFISFLVIASFFLVGLAAIDITLSIEYPALVNVLSLISRYFISAAFAVLSCFTAESFPTVGRVSCMGLCALCGNIGAVFAPQFTFLGTMAKSAHFISFGLLSLITVGVSWKLKDSTGKPLQDSVELSQVASP
ncbi:Organic cation transporter protein [Folsomia candida]|uniref:Organic cation transporter protein n=1 Tax=Folsomia candida TaxID=158441 RepID=A0A226CVE0_FOLCA|nr:Organic cation transporter protein [Folsomia candida]